MSFKCQYCQYQTSVKCNWEKHISTKKHQLIINNLKKNIKYVEPQINNVAKNNNKSINFEPINTEIDIKNKKLMCEWCNRYYSRKDSLQRHLKVCQQYNALKEKKMLSQNIQFKCKFCDTICSKQSNLNRHFKTCQVLIMTLEREKEGKNDKCPQVSTSDPVFKCFYCHNLYANSRSLNKHMNSCPKKKQEIELIKLEKEMEIIEKNDKCPQVSTSVHNFKCCYCNNLYANSRSLNKHMYTCQKRIEEIKNIERENETKTIKLEMEKEKEQAINKEKDKCIEIAKQTKIVNNIQNNKTINFLNQNFGSMIAMEQFLHNLEYNQKLTIEERKMLLLSLKEGGMETFYRSFNYVMKQNCKRQLENIGLQDMKLLPLYCSDGSYRSHKEKENKGWKTKYDNKNINRMLDICNNQIYESCQELLLVAGKDLTKLYKEVKKSNHEDNLKDNLEEIIEKKK